MPSSSRSTGRRWARWDKTQMHTIQVKPTVYGMGAMPLVNIRKKPYLWTKMRALAAWYVCVCVCVCVCAREFMRMHEGVAPDADQYLHNCRRCRCCCFINTYALCRIVFTARRNHSQLSQSMAALASWRNGQMTGTNSTWHSTAVPCRAFIGSTSRTYRCSNMRCAPWIEHTSQDSCTAPRHRKIVPIHSKWPRT